MGPATLPCCPPCARWLPSARFNLSQRPPVIWLFARKLQRAVQMRMSTSSTARVCMYGSRCTHSNRLLSYFIADFSIIRGCRVKCKSQPCNASRFICTPLKRTKWTDRAFDASSERTSAFPTGYGPVAHLMWRVASEREPEWATARELIPPMFRWISLFHSQNGPSTIPNGFVSPNRIFHLFSFCPSPRSIQRMLFSAISFDYTPICCP